jgi:hypothetical protein
MAWASTRPTGVVVEKSQYFEYRPDPDNEDELEARGRERQITEFRGMTFSEAEASLSSGVAENGTITESLKATGGGSYKVTSVEDYPMSGWIKLGPPVG